MSNELESTTNNCDPSCKAQVRSYTEQVSETDPIMPKTIPCGPIFVKIPVVIAETKIIIPVVSDIKLEKEAFEIKRIKKNVYVTQCHLIPDTSIKGDNKDGMLYLEGFVRKNIEYATKDCMNADGIVSGSINHTTVKVCFSTTARVCFNGTKPIFYPNKVTEEFEIFEDTLKTCDTCAENEIGKDPCQEGFIHNEYFNEKIYCELISAKIVEADIHKNPKLLGCANSEEQTFTKFTEKMVLNLKIKLLQKQQVKLKAEDN